MTQIYFDSNYRAFGSPIDNPILTIDSALWQKYAGQKRGTTWDIIDNQFVQLTPVAEIDRQRKDAERERERKKLYDNADTMIAKHNDYVLLSIDLDGAHGKAMMLWRKYKVDVRATQDMVGYPFEVTYPEEPET